MRKSRSRPAVNVFRLVSSLLLLMVLASAAWSGGYAEAVGIMKREQTLGEASAGLLKTYAKEDPATFVRGFQLFTNAKSEFDRLLETLRAELIAEGELEGSQGFTEDLQNAAEQRVAFTDFVEEQILSQHEEGARSIAALLGGAGAVKGVTELIGVLKDAGLEIWREYKAADEAQREQILEQLDSLKWRDFGEVPALG